MVQHKVTCPRDCLYLIGVKWTKVNQVFASGAVSEGGAGAVVRPHITVTLAQNMEPQKFLFKTELLAQRVK